MLMYFLQLFKLTLERFIGILDNDIAIHSHHLLEIRINKTGVINDALGQTHSLESSEQCFRLKIVWLDIEKWGRSDNMCENNDHYQP